MSDVKYATDYNWSVINGNTGFDAGDEKEGMMLNDRKDYQHFELPTEITEKYYEE